MAVVEHPLAERDQAVCGDVLWRPGERVGLLQIGHAMQEALLRELVEHLNRDRFRQPGLFDHVRQRHRSPQLETLGDDLHQKQHRRRIDHPGAEPYSLHFLEFIAAPSEPLHDRGHLDAEQDADPHRVGPDHQHRHESERAVELAERERIVDVGCEADLADVQ